ncbi:MAG TPA: hypothetical protein PKE57_00500 [Cellvibrionaceae bacterium]|nr:hypothetical protein [Cellvibrionaceae bacterium]HMW47152.1 hypothetical protein [Cellvibrionaceae bacterium]HMW71616.1 hypothetical protein [Cellvibrionaceae bacterium]HMY40669.1 hypothetical protein [Marinagarivorans sp.]HNG58569.1 hypothetical protein [Cellvibrionaceae bacterium]
MARLFFMALCCALSACVAPEKDSNSQLWINEVVTDNDGVAIDENGQTSDFSSLLILAPRA